MAGIFMSNDGTMGQLIGAALTGSDPYAGNLAQGWAQTENARIAQERLRMDMDVKRREIEQAQREQEAFRQRAGMETAGTLQQFSRGMTPLAPTMAPITSFMPPPGGPAPTFQTLPAGQQTATPLDQDSRQRVAPQITPEQAQDLQLHIDTFTRGAKTGDEFLKLSAQAKRAWAAKYGLPLGADDQLGIATGIHGTSAMSPGNQPTEALRTQIYDEKSAAELRSKPYEWKPGAMYTNPPIAQQTLGVPAQMTTPHAPPGGKDIFEFKKHIDQLDGVKKFRDIVPALMAAENIFAKPFDQWKPQDLAIVGTYAAKIADPTTGVREGELDKWGGQGYADRIKGIYDAARGGSRLQPAAIEELRKFFLLTRNNFGSIANAELADAKRVADAMGLDWNVVKPTIMSPTAPATTGAAAGATATAPATDPSRPVFVIPGAGSAQSSATAAASANLPPAPASGPGSEAQPITGINGPRDAITKVPPGAYFVFNGELKRRQ